MAEQRGTTVRAWIAVVLWTILILRLSGEDLSAASTSRLLGPLLRWLFPDLGGDALSALHLAARKLAHVVEYAVLGGLALWALARTPGLGRRARLAGALALVLAVAVVDETHQARTAARTGSPWDVALDGVGGVLGVGGASAAAAWRRRRRRARAASPALRGAGETAP